MDRELWKYDTAMFYSRDSETLDILNILYLIYDAFIYIAEGYTNHLTWYSIVIFSIKVTPLSRLLKYPLTVVIYFFE